MSGAVPPPTKVRVTIRARGAALRHLVVGASEKGRHVFRVGLFLGFVRQTTRAARGDTRVRSHTKLNQPPLTDHFTAPFQAGGVVRVEASLDSAGAYLNKRHRGDSAGTSGSTADAGVQGGVRPSALATATSTSGSVLPPPLAGGTVGVAGTSGGVFVLVDNEDGSWGLLAPVVSEGVPTSQDAAAGNEGAKGRLLCAQASRHMHTQVAQLERTPSATT